MVEIKQKVTVTVTTQTDKPKKFVQSIRKTLDEIGEINYELSEKIEKLPDIKFGFNLKS